MVYETLKTLGDEVKERLTKSGLIKKMKDAEGKPYTAPDMDDLDQEIYMYILEDIRDYDRDMPLSENDWKAVSDNVFTRVAEWCRDLLHELELVEQEEAVQGCKKCCEDPEVVVLRNMSKADLMELLEKCPRKERIILVQMAGLDDGIPDDREALLRYLHSKNFAITMDQVDAAINHCLELLRIMNRHERREFKYYYPF